LKSKLSKEKLPRKSMSELSILDTPIPDSLSLKELDKMTLKNQRLKRMDRSFLPRDNLLDLLALKELLST
jgi:hypothetical protein